MAKLLKERKPFRLIKHTSLGITQVQNFRRIVRRGRQQGEDKLVLISRKLHYPA